MTERWGWLLTLSTWAGVSLVSALLWTLVRSREPRAESGEPRDALPAASS